jgi:hypothetical protein
MVFDAHFVGQDSAPRYPDARNSLERNINLGLFVFFCLHRSGASDTGQTNQQQSSRKEYSSYAQPGAMYTKMVHGLSSFLFVAGKAETRGASAFPLCVVLMLNWLLLPL